MIEEIEQKQARIKTLIDDLHQIINDVLRQNAKFIIELNITQHLKGQNAKAGKIGTYADSTKRSRRRKGLQISFVDLEVTKNYHHGFSIFYGKDHIDLNSPETVYSIFLDNRYKDLFGLTPENLEELSNKIRPALEAEIANRLN